MSTLAAPQPALDTNPFVGPRPLRPGEPIHGRDREIRRLTNLLVAERIVLLYSPSGAGKTSLIEAGLLPRLRERRFQVSPLVRVSLRPPDVAAGANRYLVSTLQSLEAGLRPERQREPQELLDLGLEGYLREWAEQDDYGIGNELLVFDQFEEVLVLDPGDDPVKRNFFTELGAALEERGRRALFSMREDYIAALDPYLAELPTRLHTRMRLDLLSPEDARRAIQNLAASAGRPLRDTAAVALVESLRRVQAQRDGELIYVPGPVVEPLQLQVVCRRLWDSLSPDATEITDADVERLGGIQDALAGYYSAEVGRIARASGVPEPAIRDWFGGELVTDDGVRRQQHGPGTDPVAAFRAVRLLEDAHLIRSESRRGTRWLELAHDQLVEPIQQDNEDWRRRNLSSLQQRARQWVALDRPGDLLVTGRTLLDARRWAAENESELGDAERRFLQESAGAEVDRRRRRRNAVLLRWLAAVLVVALVVTGVALRSADAARKEAAERSEVATSRALAAEAAAQVAIDPAGAVRTAERALSHATTREAEDALRQALGQTPAAAVLAHDDNVTSVDFSPGGDRLVSSSWDGSVRIWETRTGAMVGLLPHEGGVLDARFSPDGTSVLTLTDAGRLAVWRLDDPREPVMTADGLRLPVAFSSDGTRVLAAESETSAVRVVDVATGAPVLPPLTGHTDVVNSVAVSADGAVVVTGGQDGTVRVWDAGTGAQLAVLDGPGAPVQQAAVRGDSRAAAAGYADGSVRIWRRPGPATPLVLEGQPHGGSSVAFTPAGDLLAYGDKSPRLFDSGSGALVREFTGHRSWVWDVRLSQDGHRAVTTSTDGTARLWDVASGQELAVLRGHDNSTAILAAVDATGTAVATTSGKFVNVYAAPRQQVLNGYDDWALDATTVPEAGAVVAGGHDGIVRVWDAASGTELARLAGPRAAVAGVAADPSGRYVAAAVEDGSTWVWDWRQGTVMAQRQLMTVAVKLSFDNGGTRLVVAGDPAVVGWDWTAGPDDQPQTVVGGADAPRFFSALALSPDGRYLATSSGTALEIWTTSGEFQQLLGHRGTVRDVAYSRDGRQLVTAGADGTARIWTVADDDSIYTLEPVRTLEGHRGEVWSAAFDDSGQWIVTGGDDGVLGVWDAASGKRLGWLPRHGDTVNSVEFTPGQHPRILSAGDDSTVWFVDCETCAPLDRLRADAERLLAADQRANPHIPAVGECFAKSTAGMPVDCAKEHGSEVFAISRHPGGPDAPFPSDVTTWAQESCQGQAYTDYRGMQYSDDPDYVATAYGPTTSVEWDLGQRTFVCVLTPLGQETTTGSARQGN